MLNSKKKVLLMIGIILIGLPVAFMVTFLLFPFWSWIESSFGVESVGHSGPAEWCFYATYSIVVVFFIGVSLVFLRSKKESN